MKILFVIKMVETTEPMGIMLLSALAKRDGHQTFLHVLEKGGLETELGRIKPDVVAYSSKTGEHKYYVEANQRVKKFEPAIFTIIGGAHPTFWPQLINETNFDAIGVGECDDAWPELLKAVEMRSDINNIPNIITKENFEKSVAKNDDGKFIVKNIRPKREILDDLPFLDYDLFYQNTNFTEFSPKRSIMASRGCPNQCTYCFNRRYNELYAGKGRIYRRFSVDRLIAELKHLKEKYPDTQFIKFYDDVFALTADDWLREFAVKYKKEINLPFLCLTRADCIARHPEIIYLLKSAGIYSLSMSIESGNDFVRNEILERHMSREQMIFAFRLAFDLGIPTFANSIFAIPVKKEIEKKHNLPKMIDRDIESMDLTLDCWVTISEFPILFPYPGTKLGDYCVKEGFFNGDYDKLHASYQTQSPMNFSKKEKMMQQNLALLATACTFFGGHRNNWIRKNMTPLARNLIKLLIHLPLTKFYFLLYSFSKNYIYKYRIYATKFSMLGFIKSTLKSFFIDTFKQFGNKRKVL